MQVKPLFLPSKSLLSPKIVHRYSIDTPSIVHRFDGAAMEMRWTSDGDPSEEEPCFCGIIKAKQTVCDETKNGNIGQL